MGLAWLRLCRPSITILRCVKDSNDLDSIGDHFVHDEIGQSRHDQFSRCGCGALASHERKPVEVIDAGPNTLDRPGGRGPIVTGNVVVDFSDIGESRSAENELHSERSRKNASTSLWLATGSGSRRRRSTSEILVGGQAEMRVSLLDRRQHHLADFVLPAFRQGTCDIEGALQQLGHCSMLAQIGRN